MILKKHHHWDIPLSGAGLTPAGQCWIVLDSGVFLVGHRAFSSWLVGRLSIGFSELAPGNKAVTSDKLEP